MSPRKRFLIGGLGGIAPVLLFLITADLAQYLTRLDTPRGFGYLAAVSRGWWRA